MTEQKSEKKDILVIEHEFIPKHELISEEAAVKILDEYCVKREQLPKIFKTDLAIRHLGAKRGDIIKITRKSLTAGRAIYYRVVI